MKKYYYLDTENQHHGPHTESELNDLAGQGAVSSETMVCAEGDKEWHAFKDFKNEPEPGPNIWASAWTAVRSIAVSPVEGVQVAGAKLEDKMAGQIGLLFAGAFAVCLLLAANQASGQTQKDGIVQLLLPSALFTAVFLASSAVGVLLARKVFSGQGSVFKDCFLAGAAMLPIAVIILLQGLLGRQNPEVLETATILLTPLTVLILYGGCRGLANMSQQSSALSVPIILATAHWLVKVAGSSLLEKVKGFDFFSEVAPF